MKRLEGKVAVVTGGCSGIGKAIALLFQAEGASVVATDLQDRLTVAEKSATLLFKKHDVTSEAQWQSVLDETVSEFGGIDTLVNCAGIAGLEAPQDARQCSLATWRAILAVNLDGVFLGCRNMIPILEKRGAGSIVNISSYAAHIGVPYAVAYGASKAAVTELTKSVALYCLTINKQIRCNSIAPGAIDTPIWDGFFGTGAQREKRSNSIRDWIPMKQFGTPADIAAAALYLASSESKFMTGSEISIDGGQAARG